ncbi:MAG: YceI family protein [Shimia sp.]
MLKHLTTAALLILAPALQAQEGGWTLDGGASHLAFGSIKSNDTGEVHTFTGLSGSMSADGMVEMAIDLSTVETNIDIRNERMQEHVFGDATTATLSVEIDMAEVEGIGVGETGNAFALGTLSFLGQEVPIESEMFVVRLAEDRVMASTQDMVFLRADDAGIMAGLDTLMEIAGLPSITRTSPVTVRLIFDAQDSAS